MDYTLNVNKTLQQIPLWNVELQWYHKFKKKYNLCYSEMSM